MPSKTIVATPGLESQPSRVARTGMLSLVLLALGHAAVDLYSGALGALQPLLVERYQMTLAQAGMLGGFLVFSSSVMQPVYGYWSDRLKSSTLASLGPVAAGIFISSIGLAPSYGWLVVMVLLGGAGIAAFHPQASSQAVAGVEENRGRAMAFFISAGTLGFALGPTYFSLVAGWAGLGQMYWAAIPGILIGALLLLFLPKRADTGHPHSPGFDWKALHAVRKPLALLYALVFLRSVVQITFNQLIPLYLHRERGYSLLKASSTLSLYLVFGAVGGFVGGHLSDRFGGRRVILFSMIGSVPFLLLFFLTRGLASEAGLMLGGLILLFTIPVNVVMAQQLVPSQSATISALMMGFAWGMSGIIFIPLTGWLSDLISMHYALMLLTVFPVLGFFLSLRLPK
jgi:MFS transporter, FSR family, fosmidomycin resistance protein